MYVVAYQLFLNLVDRYNAEICLTWDLYTDEGLRVSCKD